MQQKNNIVMTPVMVWASVQDVLLGWCFSHVDLEAEKDMQDHPGQRQSANQSGQGEVDLRLLSVWVRQSHYAGRNQKHSKHKEEREDW